MATQTWNFDTSHSGIHFSVRHMMIAKVRGAFGSWSGSVTIDDADFSKSKLEVSIDAASIDTHEAKRDGHLKGADFFDVEKFPKLTFTGKRVEGKGENFKVVGDLTMHGVTKEVVLSVEATGAGKDPYGNERLAYTGRTSVNRSDFGLVWNVALEAGGVLVAEKVEIEVEVSALKAK